MLDVMSVDEVIEIIQKNFSDMEPGEEAVDISDGIGRVLAEDIISKEDIPGFHRSSVDGYAVISSDTFGAGESIPAQLKLLGEVNMGEKPDFPIAKGQAAYVPTGGELPQNADSVVMVEYSENFNDGFIYINKPAAPGNNIVFKGDDTRVGNLLLLAGQRLRPQDIGVLAAIGLEKVRVKRKIKVGIISTGDEIISINEKPCGSQVRDINSYTVYAGIAEYGAQPVLYGIVKDDYEILLKVAENALKECHAVIISGGSSVGTKDVTRKVIDALGSPGTLVHGIAVKPGKPTILGKVRGKAVIGLPGHPASAYVIFKIFVYKLFDVITKVRSSFNKSVTAEIKSNYPSNNGREEFLPVKLECVGGKLFANPVFGKSGLITLLSSADGYVHISRGCEGLSAGQKVEVIIF